MPWYSCLPFHLFKLLNRSTTMKVKTRQSQHTGTLQDVMLLMKGNHHLPHCYLSGRLTVTTGLSTCLKRHHQLILFTQTFTNLGHFLLLCGHNGPWWCVSHDHRPAACMKNKIMNMGFCCDSYNAVTKREGQTNGLHLQVKIGLNVFSFASRRLGYCWIMRIDSIPFIWFIKL